MVIRENKKINAEKIRRKFGSCWNYEDNYMHHDNGKVWLLWKPDIVHIRVVNIADQYIHVEVCTLDRIIQYVATIIYTFNQLEKRKLLWKRIEALSMNVNSLWIVIGDFNNVLTSQDRIGGNNVTEAEYKDLANMMQITGLFEARTAGSHFTWSNKQTKNAIYSRIDRLIGNVQWFQQLLDVTVEVLLPNISDHAPLKVTMQKMEGTTMFKLWAKLKNLQPILHKLNKQYTNIQQQIQQARRVLEQAQNDLNSNLFDAQAIEHVKHCTDQITRLNQLEESILLQKSIVTWFILGDGNNSFFHASVKEKNNHKGIHTLTSLTREILNTQDIIEKEIN
ncbi:uncharacterized protein LOC131619235 [Vicia villosa]|uniref:uncharacterized protein LOC131619235 n=1 Tax=Vicia villosa TaxID=3911 RepID=UPI00273AA6CE|nr:uncharacterized protein LOC131619235 [Vicia villosa]